MLEAAAGAAKRSSTAAARRSSTAVRKGSTWVDGGSLENSAEAGRRTGATGALDTWRWTNSVMTARRCWERLFFFLFDRGPAGAFCWLAILPTRRRASVSDAVWAADFCNMFAALRAKKPSRLNDERKGD